MVCPNCGSDKVVIQMVQDGATTRTKGSGCLWRIGRACLILCTCGLWLLVGKRKGKSKTKVTSHKEAICQTCGHSWMV